MLQKRKLVGTCSYCSTCRGEYQVFNMFFNFLWGSFTLIHFLMFGLGCIWDVKRADCVCIHGYASIFCNCTNSHLYYSKLTCKFWVFGNFWEMLLYWQSRVLTVFYVNSCYKGNPQLFFPYRSVDRNKGARLVSSKVV